MLSLHFIPVIVLTAIFRLPCLFHCDMVPTCKERKPVNEIGRETEPSTLQFQVQTSRSGFNKRLGLLRDESPPDFIKQLVKGLSTKQVIQVRGWFLYCKSSLFCRGHLYQRF